MPLKLIGILALIVLVAVLTGFNLSNTCTIWFFHNFKDIPVFAALLGAFLAGVIITLPFTFRKKTKKVNTSEKKSSNPSETKNEEQPEGTAVPKS